MKKFAKFITSLAAIFCLASCGSGLNTMFEKDIYSITYNHDAETEAVVSADIDVKELNVSLISHLIKLDPQCLEIGMITSTKYTSYMEYKSIEEDKRVISFTEFKNCKGKTQDETLALTKKDELTYSADTLTFADYLAEAEGIDTYVWFVRMRKSGEPETGTWEEVYPNAYSRSEDQFAKLDETTTSSADDTASSEETSDVTSSEDATSENTEVTSEETESSEEITTSEDSSEVEEDTSVTE